MTVLCFAAYTPVGQGMKVHLWKDQLALTTAEFRRGQEKIAKIAPEQHWFHMEEKLSRRKSPPCKKGIKTCL